MSDSATINPDTDKMLFSFDDIECGQLAALTGDLAIVIGKGEHVSRRDGRHIELQFIDEGEAGTTRHPKLKENIVNRYLNEKRRLWIDFGNKLNPYEEQ